MRRAWNWCVSWRGTVFTFLLGVASTIIVDWLA